MEKHHDQLLVLPLECLQRGKYQPRQQFNQTALAELAASIAQNGVIEPLIVRPVAENDLSRYEIIAGERRWRAAQLAGLKTVPCIVKHYNEALAAEITLIENIQREDLNPIEEAKGYQQLIDLFHYIHEEVAIAVGKSRTYVTNSLRLLGLDRHVQKWLMESQLSAGHGRALAVLAPAVQCEMAQRCISLGWSVRQLEQEVKKRLRQDESKDSAQADVELRRLERSLAEYIGSPVAITWDNKSRGEVKLQFQNLDILQGIFQKMGFQYGD